MTIQEFTDILNKARDAEEKENHLEKKLVFLNEALKLVREIALDVRYVSPKGTFLRTISEEIVRFNSRHIAFDNTTPEVTKND